MAPTLPSGGPPNIGMPTLTEKASPASSCKLCATANFADNAGSVHDAGDNGHLVDEHKRFNTIHSSILVQIERSFGLLKCKWRRLQHHDMLLLEKIPDVIDSACVLHNMVLIHEGITEDLDEDYVVAQACNIEPVPDPADNRVALLNQADSCEKPACYEKTVTLSKEPHDSLGMTVAGGMSSRGWDLPVYVTNVDPNGVASESNSGQGNNTVLSGDILLNVNGLDLTGVTRGEAVANLKNTTSPVVLKVLEMRPPEESQPDCPSPPCLSPSPTDSTKQSLATLPHTDDYSPLWVSWLQLPRHLYCCKDIVLRRSTSGSLGFSIVGGQEEVNCNQSFFIRSIVEGTPAYNDGRIRCGDILLEVNGKSTWGMTHTALVRLLKELRGRITLTIVSWPGSLL
ncbi:unnamed protein product [Coregonus sp. 'balchen']|nr:unnamed protein product [Coregonus sp. 'balchen']